MEETRGSRLRTAMRARGLTKLSAMAAAVGVTESAISRWCHDGAMTIDNVVVVCGVLEISIDWLLLGRGEMEQHQVDTVAFHPLIARAVARMKPHVREHLSRFLSTVQEDPGDR
ncbi:helix-turn-helix domain-containing protein [Dyella japonica]|uniref:helix-turn-helix domain-containing protein n=1 Tax=Dyella japonica TaxID=231455 RepID=UPI0009E378B5|nr:helix-turn-helix transcriptional regulator [Dyella japonica]